MISRTLTVTLLKDKTTKPMTGQINHVNSYGSPNGYNDSTKLCQDFVRHATGHIILKFLLKPILPLLLLIVILFKISAAFLQFLKFFKFNCAINKPAVLLWILVTATILHVVLISQLVSPKKQLPFDQVF